MYEASTETIKFLSEIQLAALLAVAKKSSVRDYAILLTAYTHAMRISEIGRLQIQDYDPATRRLKMRRVKRGHSPSYRTSEEVHKAMMQWIKIRGPLSGPLFVSRRSKLGTITPRANTEISYGAGSAGSGRGNEGVDNSALPRGITKRTLHNIFVRYATAAGLPEDLRHFHTLRHSCAVHMVDKNVPIVQIQDWLGHKNIASTMVYVHVSDAKRDETAAIFHGESLQLHNGQIGQGMREVRGVQWSKDKRK